MATMGCWPLEKPLNLMALIFLFSNGACDLYHDSQFCDETGGWFVERGGSLADEGRCNIDIREDSLTQEEFISEYAYKRPVIIEFSSSYNQDFRKACSKEEMINKYSDKVIRLSSANTHSYEKRDVKLADYVSGYLQPQNMSMLGSETFYWFGDNNHTEWDELFNLYNQPAYTVPGLVGSYSFGVAGPGTGVPFHWHGPGFAECVFGRKRWFLYPFEEIPSFHPNKTTLQWLVEEYPDIPSDKLPYECTLHPNQAIYFPNRWWHATLNLDVSVFISTFLG